MNKGKNHIIFCSTSIADYDRRIHRIIRALLSDGYKISWISRKDDPDFSIEGITHIDVNSIFKSGFLFYAIINFKLFYHLLAKRKTVISAVDLDTVLSAFLVSKFTGRTLIFDSHEYFPEVPELLNRKGIKNFWMILGAKICPQIEYNYTVGPSLQEIFAEKYNVPYHTILNIDHDAKQALDLRNRKFNQMIYLGVINEGRGIEIAIESLRLLPQKNLLIIGDGDLTVNMKALAIDLNVSDRVEFLGYIQPKDIANYLENSWIGINLLDNQSLSYYYSLANKYFDYIHAQLPCISMNFPEYSKIQGKCGCGVLIENYAIKDFVSAVKQLENKELYNSCVDGCVIAAKEYNWSIEKSKLLTLYEQWLA